MLNICRASFCYVRIKEITNRIKVIKVITTRSRTSLKRILLKKWSITLIINNFSHNNPTSVLSSNNINTPKKSINLMISIFPQLLTNIKNHFFLHQFTYYFNNLKKVINSIILIHNDGQYDGRSICYPQKKI